MKPATEGPAAELFALFETRRKRSEAVQDEFVRNPAFPVAGLAYPALEPKRLLGVSWSSDAHIRWADGSTRRSEGVDEVSLFYGRMDSPSGPAVTVRTALVGDYGHQPNSLEVELARERERIYVDAGIDEADPLDPPVHLAGTILIDGLSVRADVCSHGDLWAARGELRAQEVDANHTRPVVTVVTRAVPSEELRLTWIDDLEPYAQERRRLDEERRAEALQIRPRVFSPDLDVSRALIEVELKRRSRQGGEALDEAVLAEDLATGGSPRRGRRSGEQEEWTALAQAAIDSQSRTRGQSPQAAFLAVTAMINQMVELAQAAPWFEADAALRDAAIEETVAYTARGEVVHSQKAQEAWENLRGRQLSRLLSSLGRGVHDDIEAHKERGAALYHEARDGFLRDTDRSIGDRDQWLREWNQWVIEQRS